MKNLLQKIRSKFRPQKLNPEKPEERRKIIQEAVKRSVKEYGEALKKLGTE